MDIRNCSRCGNIYNYNGNAVCNNCTQQEQEDFQKVREYLFGHPNSPATEINQATGVEGKVITRFLKEGRLRLEGDKQGDILNCEKCGTAIKTGRFCEKCLQEMQTEFKQAIKPPPKVTPGSNGNPWAQGKVFTYDHILKKKDD